MEEVLKAEEQQQLPFNPNSLRCYLPERLRMIVLAAGHPWGAQAFFTRVPGVAECLMGYVNGNGRGVDFQTVDRGKTGYAFALRIKYDPGILPLYRLLEIYFSLIRACEQGHQGYDWGSQYRTGIYYLHAEDQELIETAFRHQRTSLEGRIVTEFKPVENFILAEEEQQSYLEHHPEAYCAQDLSLLARLGEAG